MAKVRLTLRESKKEIEAKINKALKKEVDKVLLKAAGKLVAPIRRLIKGAILDQPEVASLQGGLLQADFGLPRGSNAILQILDIWANGIKINVKKSSFRGGKFTSSMTIQAIEKDYADVFAHPESVVITEKGTILPWLEWLLRFGDKTIVRDYTISYQPRMTRKSRSGLAVMVKDDKKQWHVPSQFSGTATNNFVTRALDSIQDEVLTLLQKELGRI